MTTSIRCSGKRCPVQYDRIDPAECTLYDQCPYYTSVLIPDNGDLIGLGIALLSTVYKDGMTYEELVEKVKSICEGKEKL